MIVTEEQFTAAMRAAVEERGADYVYPVWDRAGADDYHDVHGTCKYSTPDGTPACIVGLALSKIDPALVPDYSANYGAHGMVVLGARSNLAYAAGVAQQEQDAGGTWGSALEQYLYAIGGAS